MAGQIAVRAVLAQDRILNIEKKFFCDRTTEKTVMLDVSPASANMLSFLFPFAPFDSSLWTCSATRCP